MMIIMNRKHIEGRKRKWEERNKGMFDDERK
jgi:hypothetical protein